MAKVLDDLGFKVLMAEVVELAGDLLPDNGPIGGDQSVVTMCGLHGPHMVAIAAVRLLKITFAAHPSLVDDFKVAFTNVIATDVLEASQNV